MVWFGDKERAIATTIGALSIPLGNIFGFVLPVFFFRDIEDNEWQDPNVVLEALDMMRSYIFG